MLLAAKPPATYTTISSLEAAQPPPDPLAGERYLPLSARHNGRGGGALPLALLALGAGVRSFGYAGELSSADLPTSLVWAKIQYLGIGAVPLAWLAFALQYTNHERWLTRRTILLLALMPLTTLLLAWTNE